MGWTPGTGLEDHSGGMPALCTFYEAGEREKTPDHSVCHYCKHCKRGDEFICRRAAWKPDPVLGLYDHSIHSRIDHLFSQCKERRQASMIGSKTRKMAEIRRRPSLHLRRRRGL